MKNATKVAEPRKPHASHNAALTACERVNRDGVENQGHDNLLATFCQSNNNTNQRLKLLKLANKLSTDCYCLKPSKEIICDFIFDIERLRGEL